ncbi:MAG: hypothetical protein ABJD07_16355 [Gemmatimonadaceae bacterium]
MQFPTSRGASRVLGPAAFLALTGVTGGAVLPSPADAAPRSVVSAPVDSGANARVSFDTLSGRSGKLRARFLSAGGSFSIPVLSRLFGDSAGRQPGVYTMRDSAQVSVPASLPSAPSQFAFITMRPFSDKQDGRIGNYRIGDWPFEHRTPRSAAYANPDGFIEVTPENQDTYVSDHFRLRDFLTHDQQDVWPKYLVLNERLIDKLELVMDELRHRGHTVQRLSILSGFRTPQYNDRGVGEGGRAGASRHQYGDAADVYVDNGNGRMADLNHDGRVDSRDVRVILAAVEQVELSHPDLVGGVGIYPGNSVHGPFAHIDTRGDRARWVVSGHKKSKRHRVVHHKKTSR